MKSLLAKAQAGTLTTDEAEALRYAVLLLKLVSNDLLEDLDAFIDEDERVARDCVSATSDELKLILKSESFQ